MGDSDGKSWWRLFLSSRTGGFATYRRDVSKDALGLCGSVYPPLGWRQDYRACVRRLSGLRRHNSSWEPVEEEPYPTCPLGMATERSIFRARVRGVGRMQGSGFWVKSKGWNVPLLWLLHRRNPKSAPESGT